MTSQTRPPIQRLALITIAVLWWIAMRVILMFGPSYLPVSILSHLTFDLWVALAQIGITTFGLILVFTLGPKDIKIVPVTPPTLSQLGKAVASAPILFVLALAVGTIIALPTLMEEFEKHGSEISKKNLGELGRVLRESPIYITVFWGVIIAPIAEEFLFRGALWTSLAPLTSPAEPTPPAEDSSTAPNSTAPNSMAIPVEENAAVKLFSKVTKWLVRWFQTGGIATIITSIIFALAHDDTPGGVGIIRVVTAGCVGFVNGAIRQSTGALTFPIVLHAFYNLISVGHTRGWWVSETFPTHFGIPMLMVWAALLGIVTLIVIKVVNSATKPSAHIDELH